MVQETILTNEEKMHMSPEEKMLTRKKLYMHMLNRYTLKQGAITQKDFEKLEVYIEDLK